jgi:hypothetical protein
MFKPLTINSGIFMRVLIAIAISTVLFSATLAEETTGDGVIRLSEPVEVTDEYEVFGSRVEQIGEVKGLSEIIANAAAHDDTEVFVRAKVAKVCQKKGCFFVAQDGDAIARITFVDYSFFVPTDSGGKDVTIVGTFGTKLLSEEKARHYAQDAGTDPSQIAGPKTEYSIVATSVIIPKT